ncbi:sterol desaturase [Rhodospirillales bacterium 47_12_T64]|nr:sterol desaturase [Rhodospirillales bacterium 47_12_T64]
MEELTNQLIAYKGIIVVTWIALLFLSERLFPAVNQGQDGEAKADITKASIAKASIRRVFPLRVRRNIGLWMFNIILSPLIVIQLTLWATSHSLDWRPLFMTGWQGLLLDILVMDFLIYWWHRLNHEVPFLWRFHEIHHLDDTLDTTSALRFHFGEVLLSATARAGVVLILDISFISVVVFETTVLIATVFHHSNIKLPKRLESSLKYVFITPEIHWIHHHAIRVDTDSNYGTVFSWWDPLFRTNSKNPRKLDMRIGVEGIRDKGFLSLLIRPFIWKRN